MGKLSLCLNFIYLELISQNIKWYNVKLYTLYSIALFQCFTTSSNLRHTYKTCKFGGTLQQTMLVKTKKLKKKKDLFLHINEKFEAVLMSTIILYLAL